MYHMTLHPRPTPKTMPQEGDGMDSTIIWSMAPIWGFSQSKDGKKGAFNAMNMPQEETMPADIVVASSNQNQVLTFIWVWGANIFQSAGLPSIFLSPANPYCPWLLHPSRQQILNAHGGPPRKQGPTRTLAS
jgi:hypothetical protein